VPILPNRKVGLECNDVATFAALKDAYNSQSQQAYKLRSSFSQVVKPSGSSTLCRDLNDGATFGAVKYVDECQS
jgi:hypothetical protein